MAELVDTGVRETYAEGGQREITGNKGRCDLCPLDVVADLMRYYEKYDSPKYGDRTHVFAAILDNIDRYIYTGGSNHLLEATCLFMNEVYYQDLPTTILDVAHHYEDGARKYTPRNWEKGLPLHTFIDSGVRHLLKYMREDNDEPHDRAFIWNMLSAIWIERHKPDFNDMPFNKDSTEVKNNDS